MELVLWGCAILSLLAVTGTVIIGRTCRELQLKLQLKDTELSKVNQRLHSELQRNLRLSLLLEKTARKQTSLQDASRLRRLVETPIHTETDGA